jgi:hypothetical protein
MKTRVNSQWMSGGILAAVLIAAVSVSAVQAQGEAAGDPIVGKWEVTQTFGERENFSELEIKRGENDALTATWNGQELSDVKFEENKLTFARKIRFGDQENTIDFSGPLKDGKIAGEVSSDWGAFPAVAARMKPLSPAVGAWRMTFRIGDREIVNRLAISEDASGKLAGDLTSENAEHVISNVKFDDGKLTYDRRTKIDDFDWESNFVGAIKDGELSGAYETEQGELPVKAERIGADFVGKWELTGDFQFGGPTRSLRIAPDLSARYQLFDGVTPVDELKLDGDAISFELEAGFGEETFTLEFKGKLENGKLTGEIGAPRGNTAVTGEKIE